MVMSFAFVGTTYANDGEPTDHPTASEPITVLQLNELVDSAAFVLPGCSGSLIAVEPAALILTNHHCVDAKIRKVSEDEVRPDGTVKKVEREVRSPVTVGQKSYEGSSLIGESSYQADIVGYDEVTDLALLKIRSAIPNKLVMPVIRKGTVVARGEKVYAVGNPLFLTASVTAGIVSTFREFERRNGKKVTFTITDAGIFFGNSGGSLLNQYGQLVGVPAVTVPGAQIGGAIHHDHIYSVLTAACFGELVDNEADDEACRKKRDKKPEDEKSVKDLLQEILDEHKK